MAPTYESIISRPPASGADQFRAVLKKIVLSKSRKRVQLACDFVFPLLMIGLCALYKLSPTSKDITYPELLTGTEMYPLPSFEQTTQLLLNNPDIESYENYTWIAKNLERKRSLLVLESQKQLFLNLKDNMTSTLAKRCDGPFGVSTSCESFPALCGDLTQLDIPSADVNYCPSIQYIADADEMQQWALDNDRDFWAGLEFGPSDGANTTVTIRMLANAIPSTDSKFIEYSLAHLKQPYRFGKFTEDKVEAYFTSGFVTLQLAVSWGLQNTQALELPTVRMLPHVERVKQADYSPFASYFVLMFLPFAINLSREMLFDKENKIKEAMSIMGMQDWVFWAAWAVVGVVTSLIIGSVLVALGVVLAFKSVSVGWVLLSTAIFCLTVVSFTFSVYAMVSKAKSGAVLMLVMYYASNVTYSAFRQSGLSSGTLKMLGIFPQAAFQESITQMCAGFSSISEERTTGYPFSAVLTIQVLDLFLWTFLAWYLDKVVPGEYGLAQPWYFLCSKRYWQSKNDSNMSMELSDQLVSEHMEDQEAVSEELAGRPCVRALDLHKTFKVNLLKDSPKDKVAVDGVSFAMYEGQVFSLLGHNGAGKSTTISMMCGLLSTTKGTCDIFGSDIQQDKMAARQAIGFCPQHNILIDTLTVKEHVELFCAIKGVPADEVEAEVTARLGEIGLADKANNLVMQLSGGMQRKLSVAISLTAGSRFVILDEPTAGMDPVSRRAVWEVLQRNTRNRVILLTTHFMDEADILGDRICILSNGKVRTCGSSLFLKNKFGLGYYLTMTISPDAKVDEKQVAQAIASEAPSSEHASTKARELAYRLRFEDAPRFGAVLRMLQSQREELGIESFGLSMTTLEEVFLRLADEGQADEDGGTMEHSKLAGSTAIDVKSVENGSESLLPKDRAEQPVTSMSVHFKALLRKRIIHSGRRLSDPLCALLTPFFCVLLGCILAVTLNLDSGSTTPLNIGANDMCLPAKALPSFETPFAGSAPKSLGAASSAMDLKGFASTLEMEKYILSVSADSTEDDDQVLGMPGAFAFPNASDGSVVYYNQRAAHATPMMVSLLANASSPRIGLVDWPLEPPKKLVPAALIVTDLLAIGLWFLPSVFVFSIIQDRKANTKHQLRVMGADMKAYWLAQIFADYVISVAVGVLIIILIASFNITGLKGNKLVFIALELLISPLPNVAFAYFVSYFIEDPASARGLLVVCNFLLGMIPYITNIILVLLEYFTASTILTFTCGIFPPFAMLCGLFNLSYVSDDVTISELFSLSPVRPFPGADGTLVAPGTVLIILVVTFPFWTMLTWLMERYYQHGFRACLTKCCKSLFCSGPAAESAAETAAETAEENDIQRDDDVMAEQATVQALAVTDQQSASYDPNGQQYVMVVDGVSKVYPARGAAAQHVAVDDFYLAIPQGECFGLLGPNGAGKTSLVKILTGDQLASAGDGFAARNGTLHSVTSSVDSVYQILGYTPQFDALWDELTGREHLELFAAIKGTPADAVTQTIHKLELDQYADKCAGTYSGGNKRKLSVAIALFSDPTLVFLDEPSTGMDPGAKRKMWDLISDTMKGRGVVLTTHSMEEADVLCQRIAIMVNGRLGCLGSSQHLKTLYGKDYVLEINLAANLCNVDEAGEKVDDFVKKQICAGATLGEMPSPELRNYSLPSGAFDLASAFDLMEANKSTMQVANYSISQTSLEQVFIRFSKFQKVNDELS